MDGKTVNDARSEFGKFSHAWRADELMAVQAWTLGMTLATALLIAMLLYPKNH